MRRSCAMACAAVLLFPAAAKAEDSFARCLAQERFAVATGESFWPLERGSATSHTLSLTRKLVDGLRRFNARGIVQVSAPVSPIGSLDGVSRPLSQAAAQGASLLVALGLDAKEFRLINEFLDGDQYPLRTVRVRVTGWVIDAATRRTVSEFSVEHAYAADSTDEAVDRLTDDELAEALAEALQIGCEELPPRHADKPAPAPPIVPSAAGRPDGNAFARTIFGVLINHDRSAGR